MWKNKSTAVPVKKKKSLIPIYPVLQLIFETHSKTHNEGLRDGSLKYRHTTLKITVNSLILGKTGTLY